MRKFFIVGTAGHVDHGKSSLIRALTGIETDRLPEEQARGLSIDLGFAHLALPGDVVAGIVDVPGHQRFLKNMLAGVGGYDLGLLVVDAQEGVMPQTREHVEILELLKTPRGLVVLTKADLVDADFLELVRDDLSDFLKGTFLEGTSLLACSSKTGQGLDELKAELGRLLGRASVRDRQARVRLPIDRSFLKAGFGTVVTGSLWSGTMRKGDHLVLWPSGDEVKVRGLQSHGQECEEAFAGQRLAVNLSGIEPGSVKRGMLLATPGWLSPTQRLDVRLHLPARLPRPLRHRTRIRAYQGTAEAFGRVLLLEGDEAVAESTALAQLELEQPLVVVSGDRLILRDFTASYTLGGGEVLEPLAQPHRRKDDTVIEALTRKESGGLQQRVLAELGTQQRTSAQLATQLQLSTSELESELQSMTEAGSVVRLARGWAAGTTVEEVADQYVGILVRLQTEASWRAGWKREELLKLLDASQPKLAEDVLTLLVAQRQVLESQRLLHLPGHQPRLPLTLKPARQRARDMLQSAGFGPPDWDDLGNLLQLSPPQWKILATYLIDSGEVVKVHAQFGYLAETLTVARQRLTHIPAPFTASQAREALGTTRKFLIPLMEFFDQTGVTTRQGELRKLR